MLSAFLNCLNRCLEVTFIIQGIKNAEDIYARFGPTSEWDTAAAQCIVEEAGGSITDTQLEPLCYNCGDDLLNPHFIVTGQGLNLRDYFCAVSTSSAS